MKPFRTALVAVALLAASACQTVSYQTLRAPSGEERESHAPFFLWGIAGHHEVDLDGFCSYGPASWKDQETFLDGFLASVTLGIYTPRTVTIQCAAPMRYPTPPSAASGSVPTV